VAQAAQALRSNQPELAIRIANDGIRRYDDYAGLYRTLGTAHYRQGDYRAAQVALRQAVSLDKSHPLSYFLLSATLKKLGEEDEARRCLAQAESLDPALAAWR
jgi:tetratricopeptide (TPR) repeat protein